MVGIISVVIGDHFGGGDHFDGGDHFGGGTGRTLFGTNWLSYPYPYTHDELFVFCFCHGFPNLSSVPKNSTSEKFTYICHFKRVGLNAKVSFLKQKNSF